VSLWDNPSQFASPPIAALVLLSSIIIYYKKHKTGSLRNSLLARHRTWYGNLFWSTLTIALIVATMALVGQVAATNPPIYYGPSNSCKDGQSLVPELDWSGYKWTVSPDGYSSPGPNYWSSNNVWVDSNGDLHLRISKSDNKWCCAEITTQERLPFGKYQFWVIGRLDHLDKNVVLGLFNYPISDVGPDGTNEIGIEMSRWSNEISPMGSYVVWPNVLNGPKYVELFPVTLTGTNIDSFGEAMMFTSRV
jgi:hypothetical protein